jgi:hypothetical protein
MVLDGTRGYDEIEPHVQEFIGALDYSEPVTGADIQDRYDECGINADNPFEVLDPDKEYDCLAAVTDDLLDQ